jgi:large subunit ribosomal protein L13
MAKAIRPAAVKATRETHVLDATDVPLGRLATKIAHLLRGKHKAIFESHLDFGDFVKIEHAEQIKLTGKKIDQKSYKHYSGYPGGLKDRPVKRVLASNPAWVIRQAVWNMLPKNKLRDKMIKRLSITR